MPRPLDPKATFEYRLEDDLKILSDLEEAREDLGRSSEDADGQGPLATRVRKLEDDAMFAQSVFSLRMLTMGQAEDVDNSAAQVLKGGAIAWQTGTLQKKTLIYGLRGCEGRRRACPDCKAVRGKRETCATCDGKGWIAIPFKTDESGRHPKVADSFLEWIVPKHRTELVNAIQTGGELKEQERD